VHGRKGFLVEVVQLRRDLFMRRHNVFPEDVLGDDLEKRVSDKEMEEYSDSIHQYPEKSRHPSPQHPSRTWNDS